MGRYGSHHHAARVSQPERGRHGRGGGGETIVVTRNGTPVAEVRPVPRKPLFVNTEEMQRLFAISPSPDYALMRAEIDEFFGDDDRISDDDSRYRLSRGMLDTCVIVDLPDIPAQALPVETVVPV